MSGPEPCILTNMCMILDGENVLVLDRKDPGWPGIVFPGGHVEPGESFVDSVIREVREETGLTVSGVRLSGMKQFPAKDGSYRYIVFLYTAAHFTGGLCSSSEGRVFWVRHEDLRKQQLAHGFESMLDVFENDALSENYFYLENGQYVYKNK